MVLFFNVYNKGVIYLKESIGESLTKNGKNEQTYKMVCTASII
jgi:hypothetical protein